MMATEKRLIFLEDAIARIVDTSSEVATMAFEGYYGFIQNPANILAARQHEIIDLLEAVSTVDAVEVVRCWECKFGDMCSIREAMATSDWNAYCYRGERRSDEETD